MKTLFSRNRFFGEVDFCGGERERVEAVGRLAVETPLAHARRHIILGFAFVLFGGVGFGQLPNSDMQLISPAFGKAGSNVDVTISGTDLEEVMSLRFSDPRISVEPMMRGKDEIYPEGKPLVNQFTVTIPENVEPQIVEVRSLGYFGLSTARPFMILPKDSEEIIEEGDHSTRETAIALPIETGVRGTIDSQKFDFYKIEGKKGERLSVEVWAERLDSKADVQLKIFDATGRELAANRLQSHTRDPFIDFSMPEDGEFFIAASDVLFRGGGNSYFYRLQVSKKPHITHVWPPAGIPGEKRKFTIYGSNLPGDSAEVEIQVPADISTPNTFQGTTPRQANLAGFEYRHGDSNTVRIGFATAPVVFEEAEKLTVPCEIAGRFSEPGDVDTFQIAAKKEETIWLEVISDQMGVMADSVLIVKKIGADGEKTQVAENDDPPTFFSADRFDSTNLDTTDSSLSFTADADADYEITLINQAGGGSDRHLYRLAIRKAAPDFQLFTTTERTITSTNGRAGYPAAPLVRRSGTVAYRIIAPRRDGFDGDIVVTAEGLPPGVSAPPLTLRGSTTTGFFSVKADANAKAWAGPIRIVGRAKIGEKMIERESRNASLVWGVIFSDSFRVRSRLDLETVLSVTEEEVTPAFLTLADPAKPLKVELNQVLEIPIKVTDFDALRKGNLTVQPYGFFGMLRSPPTVAIPEGETEGVLKINFKPNGNFEAKPGKFDFLLQGIGLAKYQHNPKKGLADTKEAKRVAALEEALKKRVADAKAELDSAKKNLSTATDQDKSALEKRVSETDAAFKAAELILKRTTSTKSSLENIAKASRAKAVAKDTKFATFSIPITVEVTPVPEKK